MARINGINMKKASLYILAAAICFMACSKAEEPIVNREMTVSATIDNVATRISLAENGDGYDVVWSYDDEIIIGGKIFRIDSRDGGKTSARFNCDELLSDGTYDAFYRLVSKVLPINQTYYAGQIKNSPMYAQVTVDSRVAGTAHFKNLCGLLKLTLKGNKVKVKSIQIKADQAMAGSFEVINNGAKISSTSEYRSVTLNCGETGVALSSFDGTDFYISLPEGNYSNVSIVVTDINDCTCTKTLKSGTLDIERSKITTASFTVVPNVYNGHEFVDMGLGVKWATVNIGQSDENAYGDMFRWGETEAFTGDRGDFTMYKFYDKDGDVSNFSYAKYCAEDGLTELESSDDAATQKWGGKWHTPTISEIEELLDNCRFEMEIILPYYYLKVTSKINGNYIYLPLSTEFCHYQTSSLYDDKAYDWAMSLTKDAENFIVSNGKYDRYLPQYIRPVF